MHASTDPGVRGSVHVRLHDSYDQASSYLKSIATSVCFEGLATEHQISSIERIFIKRHFDKRKSIESKENLEKPNRCNLDCTVTKFTIELES